MKEINSIQDINKILGKEEIKNDVSSFSSTKRNQEQVNIPKDSEKKGIKSGFTITDEIIEEDKLKSKVLKYISYKKRTENEIRQKFSDENLEILDDIIEQFKKQNYINDFDYIERSVKEFFAVKTLSIKELSYKLFSKGVDKKDLDLYIYQNREILVNYEVESAKKIISKKVSKMEIENIKRYLFQKGYMSDTINIAIEEVLE